MNPHYKGCVEYRGPLCMTVQHREAAKHAFLRNMELIGGWIAEPKKDGTWCAIVVDKNINKCEIRTKTDTIRHIHSIEKHISRSPRIPNRCVLIGELGIGSQVAVKERNRIGHDFVDIFDVRLPDDLILLRRKTWLDAHLGDDEYLRVVPWILTDSDDSYESKFTDLYESEAEGVVVKASSAKYSIGTWTKVKKQFTDDYVLMGWELSTAVTKQATPMAARIKCGLYVNGVLMELVSVGSLSHNWAIQFAQNFDAYKGKVVELAHFKMFDSGSLRHPSFVRIRDDKHPSECRLEDIRAWIVR